MYFSWYNIVDVFQTRINQLKNVITTKDFTIFDLCEINKYELKLKKHFVNFLKIPQIGLEYV